MSVANLTNDFIYSRQRGLSQGVDRGTGDVSEVDSTTYAMSYLSRFAEPLIGLEKGSEG